jgi:hypothetical protein
MKLTKVIYKEKNANEAIQFFVFAIKIIGNRLVLFSLYVNKVFKIFV